MVYTKQEKQENKELLQRKNIIVKCDPLTKEDAIKKAGQLLADSGYVDQEYVAAMLERMEYVTFGTVWPEQMCAAFVPHRRAVPQRQKDFQMSRKPLLLGIMRRRKART